MDNTDNTPPRGDGEGGFIFNVKTGLGLAILPYMIAAAFFSGDANAVLISSAVSLLAWGYFVCRAVRRKESCRLWPIAGLTLGTFLCVALIGFSTAQKVVEQMQAGNVTTEFARQDFTQFEADKDGRLSAGKLTAVVERQAQLKSALAELNSTESLVEKALKDDPVKPVNVFQIHLLEQSLRLQLLPEDMVARAKTVADWACAAGTKTDGGCTVTAEELQHFRDKTEAKYRFWLVAIRWFKPV